MIESLIRAVTAVLCFGLAGVCLCLAFAGPDLGPALVDYAFAVLAAFAGVQCLIRPKQLPRRQPPAAAPGWFLPAGMIALILGILGFPASAAVEGRRSGDDLFACLLSGALNPLFFIGLPLGIYWLSHFGRTRQGRPGATTPEFREGNPRLTHCPDCGGHVSRLAPRCPHCGRPMTPDRQAE